LVEDGYTNEEIGSRLGISRYGAKFHVAEILGKLHLESRNDAARWYRARHAPVPLWAPLLDWLRPKPHMAAAAVSVAVIAVTLAAITALGMAVAGTDTGDSPGEVARLQRPPSPTPAPANAGLVPLPPGTHSPPTFWPPLTLTVPDVTIDELFQHVSWLNESEAQRLVNLVPDTTENRARTREGGFPATFLDVFPNIAVAAENCAAAAEPGVGVAASDIVGALATRPGLSTVGPVPVTIGGLSGQQIDISIAPDWTGDCPPPDGGPFVPLLYSPNFISWGAEPGERFRIIVLDVAGLPSGMYATVMIVVYAAPGAAWDDHLPASMALVESFEFDTTPPGPPFTAQ
jgi:hypothetical protein